MKIISAITNISKYHKLKIFAVSIGGALGAIARICLCSMFSNQIVAIFVCNIIGSFLLASANELKKHIHPDMHNMIAVGFCGGLSVFASFAKDSYIALDSEFYLLFFANFLGNFIVCVVTILLAKRLIKFLRYKKEIF